MFAKGHLQGQHRRSSLGLKEDMPSPQEDFAGAVAAAQSRSGLPAPGRVASALRVQGVCPALNCNTGVRHPALVRKLTHVSSNSQLWKVIFCGGVGP